jgi:hypothetical protein
VFAVQDPQPFREPHRVGQERAGIRDRSDFICDRGDIPQLIASPKMWVVQVNRGGLKLAVKTRLESRLGPVDSFKNDPPRLWNKNAAEKVGRALVQG